MYIQQLFLAHYLVQPSYAVNLLSGNPDSVTG